MKRKTILAAVCGAVLSLVMAKNGITPVNFEWWIAIACLVGNGIAYSM